MLTHHRKPVSLSFMSLDMPLWSVVETSATLYQKDAERFHLLLTEPVVLDPSGLPGFEEETQPPTGAPSPSSSASALDLRPQSSPRLLWLELSPYRVIMTMQGNGRYSYRHFWEQGIYGLSRYWLQSDQLGENNQVRLRNYTRSLKLVSAPLPQTLRVEYELWSDKVQLGHYVLNLEIHH